MKSLAPGMTIKCIRDSEQKERLLERIAYPFTGTYFTKSFFHEWFEKREVLTGNFLNQVI